MKSPRSFRMAPRFAACSLSLLCLLCFTQPRASAVEPVESAASASLAQQQFFCSQGYDPADCRMHAAALKAVLGQYFVPQLGSWNWVIVRSEDWRPLVRRLRLDERSPAFSALEQRSTYLEEALFRAEPKRSAQLEGLFHLSTEALLPLAVAHELGHAICQANDEDTANRIGEQLRRGERADCEKARGLTAIQKLYLDEQRVKRH